MLALQAEHMITSQDQAMPIDDDAGPVFIRNEIGIAGGRRRGR